MYDRRLDAVFAQLGISNETGLRCRASECGRRFVREGMSSSIKVLREIADVRDAHELEAHELVVPKHSEPTHRGRGEAMRAVIDRNAKLDAAKRRSDCVACIRGLIEGHLHRPVSPEISGVVR